MRICFTSDEKNGLESTMSYHFGHCPYFVIVEIEGKEVKNVESITNPLADEHNPGDLPQFMKEKGIDVIITGGMGPKAQAYFKDYGITPIIGAYGKVKDVLEEYLEGEVTYESIEEKPCSSEEELVEDKEIDFNKEVDRMKKDIIALRKEISDLKSILLEINKKLTKD
ncbi:MAG: NifB/NifX family molybdenum-iron cluster-binding protein [Caldisericia bacterium]